MMLTKTLPTESALKPRGRPNPVDVYVGSRIRQRRTLVGMSQEKLGQAIGLTFQQVQKYERGTNRVGASRLFQLSQILDVPVSYFFEDMPRETSRAGRFAQGLAEETAPYDAGGSGESDSNPMERRETLELVRAYYKIIDPKLRKRVFELMKAMAKGEEN